MTKNKKMRPLDLPVETLSEVVENPVAPTRVPPPPRSPTPSILTPDVPTHSRSDSPDVPIHPEVLPEVLNQGSYAPAEKVPSEKEEEEEEISFKFPAPFNPTQLCVTLILLLVVPLMRPTSALHVITWMVVIYLLLDIYQNHAAPWSLVARLRF